MVKSTKKKPDEIVQIIQVYLLTNHYIDAKKYSVHNYF